MLQRYCLHFVYYLQDNIFVKIAGSSVKAGQILLTAPEAFEFLQESIYEAKLRKRLILIHCWLRLQVFNGFGLACTEVGRHRYEQQ